MGAAWLVLLVAIAVVVYCLALVFPPISSEWIIPLLVLIAIGLTSLGHGIIEIWRIVSGTSAPKLRGRPSSSLGDPSTAHTFTLGGLLELVAVVAIVIALLQPLVEHVSRPQAPEPCRSHLRTIAAALKNYRTEFGVYPPPFLVDSSGQPAHSWRVLLLPYFDDPDLSATYEAYHFDEPWNGPRNSAILSRMPRLYRCFRDDPSVDGLTNYLAVVGPKTAFGTRYGRSRCSILVVETAGSGIPWTQPRDLTIAEAAQGINAPTKPSISSHHGKGAFVLLANDEVVFLPNRLTHTDLRTLLDSDSDVQQQREIMASPTRSDPALLIVASTAVSILVIGTRAAFLNRRPRLFIVFALLPALLSLVLYLLGTRTIVFTPFLLGLVCLKTHRWSLVLILTLCNFSLWLLYFNYGLPFVPAAFIDELMEAVQLSAIWLVPLACASSVFYFIRRGGLPDYYSPVVAILALEIILLG